MPPLDFSARISRCQSQSSLNSEAFLSGGSLQQAPLHLQPALEAPLIGIDHEEKLGATEADLGGEGLGGPIGFGQETDPLPVDPAAPALGDEGLPVPCLQGNLQNAGDAFVVIQISDPNSAAKVQELRTESSVLRGEPLRARRWTDHVFLTPSCHFIPTVRPKLSW